jgi:hypothetical protein
LHGVSSSIRRVLVKPERLREHNNNMIMRRVAVAHFGGRDAGQSLFCRPARSANHAPIVSEFSYRSVHDEENA